MIAALVIFIVLAVIFSAWPPTVLEVVIFGVGAGVGWGVAQVRR